MKPFSITYVEYEPGNLVSLAFAVISLAPILAVVGHASVLTVKRELSSIFLFLGVLLCVVLNEVLKHFLVQPRPQGSFKDGHGMPSNHSQLSFFYATSLTLLWRQRWRISDSWRIILSCLAYLIAFCVAFSRVFSGVHSLDQVVVGAVVGVCFALLWNLASQTIFQRFYTSLIELSICKYFYIYDDSCVPNPLLFEYLSYQQQYHKNK